MPSDTKAASLYITKLCKYYLRTLLELSENTIVHSSGHPGKPSHCTVHYCDDDFKLIHLATASRVEVLRGGLEREAHTLSD